MVTVPVGMTSLQESTSTAAQDPAGSSHSAPSTTRDSRSPGGWVAANVSPSQASPGTTGSWTGRPLGGGVPKASPSTSAVDSDMPAASRTSATPASQRETATPGGSAVTDAARPAVSSSGFRGVNSGSTGRLSPNT